MNRVDHCDCDLRYLWLILEPYARCDAKSRFTVLA